MSLKAKLIILIVSVLSLLVFLSILFFAKVIQPSFVAIEEKEAAKDLHRIISAIQNETDHLNSLNHDWAAWNATYAFMETFSQEYIEENLPVSSFTDNQLNLIRLYDVKGKLIWGEVRDLETEELLRLKELPNIDLPADHILLKFEYDETPLSKASIKGLWITDHGPIMLSSRPILTNENEGPARGALIMGRFLDENAKQKLIQLTDVDFETFSIGTKTFPSSLQNILHKIGQKKIYVDTSNETQLKTYTTYPDLKGDGGLVIQAKKERDIYKRSKVVMKYSLLSVLLAIFFAFVLFSIFLEKIVVKPINALAQHATKVGITGDLTSSLDVKNQDEIGLLELEFNIMLERLNDAKHHLQDQSFQQGMSELASGILHNLRNSLHKLFNNIHLLKKTMDTIPVAKITQACQELETIADNDKRKTELNDFLLATNKSFISFVDKANEKLDRNNLFMKEIEETLKSYEKWARKDTFIEELFIEPIIREAYRFVEKYSHDLISLEIDPILNSLGTVHTNRVIVLHVVINILMNAIDSMNEKQGVPGEIRIDGESQEMDDGPAVHIRFFDNGIGMDKNILRNMFERGFTTKEKRHIGLGLHWCVNSIMVLNGKLYAETRGPGKGACIHLVLPKKIENNMR